MIQFLKRIKTQGIQTELPTEYDAEERLHGAQFKNESKGDFLY